MQKQLETHGGVLRLFFIPVKNHLPGGTTMQFTEESEDCERKRYSDMWLNGLDSGFKLS